MNLVDSSAWLEYFTDGPNADYFSSAIEDTPELLVSTINLYEVFKKVYRERGIDEALKAAAIMLQGRIAEIDAELALSGARISCEVGLPMADSLILATARAFGATLWTQDSDLEGMQGVQFRSKQRP